MVEIEPNDIGGQNADNSPEIRPEPPVIPLAPIIPLSTEEQLTKGDDNDFETK